LLLTLQKCFKAFNLENDTARQRTPHGPAPGRGSVVADHCCRISTPASAGSTNVIMPWYNLPLWISILIHDTNQESLEISDNRCSLKRPTNLKINDVGTTGRIITLF